MPDRITVGIVWKREAPPDSKRLRGTPGLAGAPLPAAMVERGVAALRRRGFTVLGSSPSTLSLSVTPERFTETFRARLVVERFAPDAAASARPRWRVRPADGDAIELPPELRDLVATVEVQAPNRYDLGTSDVLPAASATPPDLARYHLELPADLRRLLEADAPEAQGLSGTGVHVAMVDTGFDASHPFYAAGAFDTTVVLADPTAPMVLGRDPDGHGTGEAANLLSVAPGVAFTCVQLGAAPGAEVALLTGLQAALALNPRPRIVSCSISIDPPWAAVEQVLCDAHDVFGITVVAAAGNGSEAFPGQHPFVVSAGGVFVPKRGKPRASNFCSAFESELYTGRDVPDCCGLVGEQPRAAWLMLPVPPGSAVDVRCAGVLDGHAGDGTEADDGWALFSGTSAAAPQIAGICALLLEAFPRLTPDELKAVVSESAVNVTRGSTNPSTGGHAATDAKPDLATGGGLVNVRTALAAAVARFGP